MQGVGAEQKKAEAMQHESTTANSVLPPVSCWIDQSAQGLPHRHFVTASNFTMGRESRESFARKQGKIPESNFTVALSLFAAFGCCIGTVPD